MRAHRRAAWFVAVGLALASGCGDDDGGGDDAGAAPEEASAEGGAEPATEDAPAQAAECPLTPEDVSAAMGEEMQPDPAPNASPCSFAPVDFPDTGPFLSYTGSSTGAVEAFASQGEQAVDGVGDEAYFLEGSATLAVRDGDTAFQLQGTPLSGQEELAALVELAEVVLGSS